MLLNILQYTALTKNCPTQNISSAVDKRQTLVLWWGEGGEFKSQCLTYQKEKKKKTGHQNLHRSGFSLLKILTKIVTKSEIGKAIQTGVNGSPLISVTKIYLVVIC